MDYQLGYRGEPTWRDMSDYLVHLVHTLDELVEIWNDQKIPVFEDPLGALWNHDAVIWRTGTFPPQHSCCLSEIPLDLLDRLTKQHGCYGVVMSRDYAMDEGAARVWYLDERTELAKNVYQIVFDRGFSQKWDDINVNDRLWKLTPYIDYLSDGTLKAGRRQFDWEREWRKVGGLRLPPNEVHLLFAPEANHDSMSDLGVLLADLSWDDERLQDTLALLPKFED